MDTLRRFSLFSSHIWFVLIDAQGINSFLLFIWPSDSFDWKMLSVLWLDAFLLVLEGVITPQGPQQWWHSLI